MILHNNTTSQLLTCRERKTVHRECGRSTGAPFPINVTDFVILLSCDKNHLSLLRGILPVLVHSIPQTNLLGEFPWFAVGDSGTALPLFFWFLGVLFVVVVVLLVNTGRSSPFIILSYCPFSSKSQFPLLSGINMLFKLSTNILTYYTARALEVLQAPWEGLSSTITSARLL